ncbi:Tubulin polyglutamylase ttll5, partial [Irineochytrium annulatum]
MPPPMTDCSDLSARSGSPLPATTGACTPRPTTTSQTPTAKSVTWRDSTGHSLCESSDSPPPEHTSSASPSAPPVPALPGGNAPSHLGLPLVTWSSGPNPIPRLRFQAVPYLLSQRQASRLPPHPSQAASSRLAGAAGSGKDDSMRLSYRVVGGAECHVVRATLAAHGFREAGPTQDDFNVMWSSGRVEMHEMRGLNRYQKVNRFPRTNEITRKDRLYLNISKMRQTYGDRHFDFMPPTFLLPQEYEPYDSNPSTSGHSMRSSIHRQKGHGEEADEDGNNWSLSEVLRHVGAKYGADSASVIMAKIKDIIVKSILSGESTVSTAVNMFVQHSGNCFELLGFDILIDQNLQPWLLEVNMSPSLTCESPLDLKVKGSLIADLFTLIGIVPFTKGVSRKSLGQVKHCRLSGAPASVNVQRAEWSPASSSDQKLTPEQQKIVRIAREELTRRGSFSRVFPTDSSAYLYSPFIPKTSLNWSVLIALYGKTSLAKPKRTSAADEAGGGRSGGASPSPRFTSLSYLIADRPASGKKDGGSGRTVSQAVPNAPWASVHHRRDVRSEYGDALALASAAEPASGVIRGGSAGVGGGAKATDELLADASGILGGMAGGRAGSGRAGSETMTAKRLAEKIQAREAFHVFLENILNRIRKFYEQSDPDSEVDLNYVRQ